MTQIERVKRLVREEILGEFGFILLWEVLPEWVDVKVYKKFKDEPLVIDENTETYLEGYLKWDGCCELDQGCPHWCGAHNFSYHILLLKYIYERAAELMESSDFDEWQVDVKIKEEYKEWYD